ncbi:hypothetical protein BDN72DRAFT_881942 [Pluteus cervinus]|uniref:Uncharacterized protein n=1 Tax=Pluteus cervinus TaxID=181527 RepID=A0ACD3ADF8_9AGAR|nr:hypothetical protein BDN72DRAFT_881942 [Pluteus cervinus]
MNGAHALPVELWIHVLKLLPREDLKTMILVHSVFRTCASPMIRRRLIICSLLPKNIENANSILEYPHLARQVTNLCLFPMNYVAADQVEPWTSLWLIAPTFWSVLKHFKLSHPISSWRYYRQSLEDIQISTKVVPLLTHVREITVIPTLNHANSYVAPLAPYRAIWAGLRTEYLQKLTLQLCTPGAIQVISKAMRSTPSVVFKSLKTLTLDLGIRQTVYLYRNLQENLRSILDCGRDSLCAFGIVVDPGDTSYFAEVVGAFGVFPNLVHFHLETSFLQFDQHTQSLGQHLLPFFVKHRSTLTKLHLSTLPISPSVISSIFGHHDDNDNSALKLEAFTLTYHLSGPSNSQDGLHMPNFRKFAGTLTCLMLVSTYHEGLSYEDVRVLLDSLRLPICGIRLKRLWISVVALSPELLDLMAGSLTNLESLRLSYGRLVGDKNQQSNDKDLFLEKMDSRSYPLWGLRYLDIKSWTEDDCLLADYLKDIIPSLIEVGTIDWGDVELKVGPWY